MVVGTLGARLSLPCAGELSPSNSRERTGAVSLRVEHNSEWAGLDFGVFMFGLLFFYCRGRFVRSIGFHSLSERKVAKSNRANRDFCVMPLLPTEEEALADGGENNLVPQVCEIERRGIGEIGPIRRGRIRVLLQDVTT